MQLMKDQLAIENERLKLDREKFELMKAHWKRQAAGCDTFDLFEM